MRPYCLMLSLALAGAMSGCATPAPTGSDTSAASSALSVPTLSQRSRSEIEQQHTAETLSRSQLSGTGSGSGSGALYGNIPKQPPLAMVPAAPPQARPGECYELVQQAPAANGAPATYAWRQRGCVADAQGTPNEKAAVRQIQAALKQAGFDPGPIDGVVGSRTRSALAAYQKAMNLPSQPAINAETLQRLGVPFTTTS